MPVRPLQDFCRRAVDQLLEAKGGAGGEGGAGGNGGQAGGADTQQPEEGH